MAYLRRQGATTKNLRFLRYFFSINPRGNEIRRQKIFADF